ncbi:LLM class F420-dependent oxidoreductase [Streptomyces sp. LHD-70]|uniref:LLM class F420-dependent oxidoreductase n=1 Tax=Streptomyces sp. LHD-70 TaxID=3072140 RepID=UPI00280E34EC|nr:LLM class F420-dependent oxidoreductase [Streptomyces sp. LHD-70]MDQ8706037.1 LLM class F420-dependent oxidoreductase [Streptomyces sp. LHD-70]
MEFAVVLPVALGVTAEPDEVVRFARHAEELGFESLSAVEHAVVNRDTESHYRYAPDGKLQLPDDCPYPDPLELLAFLAGATDRIGLSTGVLVLPNHNPVVLAKRLATLDRLSRGRLRICLGLGWMGEEIEACGGDFRRRGRIADEAIDLVRELWRGRDEQGVTFDGEFFTLRGAHSYPKPHRASGVPLHIGGHSAAAARRAGRRGDGFQPLGLAGEELQAVVSLMREEARAAGRDVEKVKLTLGAVLPSAADKVEWAEGLGADRLLLSGSRHATTVEALLEEMSEAAKKLELKP